LKVFLSEINESWIVDRIREDWYKENSDISTRNIKNAEMIWIISPWVWRKLPKGKLKKNKVICTIHHIDFDKFPGKEEKEFIKRDKYVDLYHVISKKTKEQLEKLTTKKIIHIPWWVNQNIFFEIKNRSTLREKYGFNQEEYLIGSFQRDTEGDDLKSPKLIKGPDIFLEIVKDKYKKNKNLKVVITGKRRNYLIENFELNKIPYEYFEMVDLETLNELYNILDIYLVTSRVEGGPQSIIECAINKTPVLSTDVGIASEILSKESIFDLNNYLQDIEVAKPNIDNAYKMAQELIIPKGMRKFREMIIDNYEN
tara:strand:- start:652 stop:1587 length:936 start_codon:yes stop_codon:yes gene_type:complete